MHHFLTPPDADVHNLFGRVGSQVYFDFFSQRDIWHFDLVIE